MVAYSFKGRFADAIISGRKRQTVRADRKRHARPGEPVQLYTGMRTRQCAKLLSPDPICIARQVIMIWFDDRHRIARIELDGTDLSPALMEQFAVHDGFAAKPALSALDAMAAFWRVHHDGPEFFAGVVIRWKPSSSDRTDG